MCKSVPFTNVCKLLFGLFIFYFVIFFFFFFSLQRWVKREGLSQSFPSVKGFICPDSLLHGAVFSAPSERQT